MAAVKWDSEKLINSTASGNQTTPQITALSTGGFVAVWESGNPGSQSGKGQIFDAAGNPVGGEFTVPGQGGSTEQIHVAGTSDGGFYVGWLDNPAGASNEFAYALKYTGSGAQSGGVLKFNPLFVDEYLNSLSMQTGPSGDVGFAFTTGANRWGDASVPFSSRGETSTPDATTPFTHVDAGFTPRGTRLFIATDPNGNQIYMLSDAFGTATEVSADFGTTLNDNAHLAMLSGGLTALTFQGENSVAGGQDIMAGVYDSGRNLAKITVTTLPGVGNAPGDQIKPDITHLRDNDFLVTWESASEIHGQKLHFGYGAGNFAAISKVGDEFVINTTAGANNVAITTLADGRIAAVWEAQDGSGLGIREQIIDLRDGSITGLGNNATFYGSIGNGADFIVAEGLNDTLIGLGGNDALIGGAGNDVLDGGLGSDYLDGRGGSDTVTYRSAAAGVVVDLQSGSGSVSGETDTLLNIENVVGTAFADVMIGDANDNQFTGGAGPDFFDGRGGENTVRYDSFLNGAMTVSLADPGMNTGDAAGDAYVGIQNVIGSMFSDTLAGSGVANKLFGGQGDDTLFGFGGNDFLYGEDGNDALNGGAGADYLDGGAGINTASYEGATSAVVARLDSPGVNTNDAAGDTYVAIRNLIGTSGGDTLAGDGNSNTLTGQDGNDVLFGNASADFLLGGGGDDVLIGGTGPDTLDGGTGSNTASYETFLGGAITLRLDAPGSNTGDATGDTFINIQNLTGSPGNDNLFGDGNANALFGGDGDDQLTGGAGADFFDGGSGENTVRYDTFANGAMTASLINPGQNTGDAAGDSYVRVQNLLGSFFNDNLTGNDQANKLYGLDGNDVLLGLGGNDNLFGDKGLDTLNGGGGNDQLTGGADFDTFVFDPGFGKDTILGYTPGADVIAFDHTVFADYNAVISHAANQGGSTVITLDANNTVTISGIALGLLHQNDFTFF